MKLCDINPFIRFASQVSYKSECNPVFVRDCRIFYVLSGNAEIFIENKHYNLNANSLFYCCGGSSYNIVAHENISIMAINFDLTQSNNNKTVHFSPLSAEKTLPVSFLHYNITDSGFLNNHTFIDNASEYYSAVNRIAKEYSEQKIYYNEKCSCALKELIINMHINDLHKIESCADTMNYILSYLNNNYTENITNKSLATLAGYHEYHLNRLFVKYTGTSMHKYILNLRINKAKQLILNTDSSFGKISEKVGFKDNAHFTNYFKKETGITPTQYRNKFKNMI